MNQPSLNAPCPCGSGKKYKRCCGAKSQATAQRRTEPAADWRHLVERAIACQHQGDLETARQLYDQALASQPREPTLLGLRAMVALELGHSDAARELIERAIAINPQDSRLHNILGQILFRLEEDVEAERAFGQAVTLDPGFAEAWGNLGIAQIRMNRPNEAVASLQRAVMLAPMDTALQIQLAKAHYLVRDLDKAERALRTAQSLGEYPGRANLLLCVILRAQGRQEEAEKLEQETLHTYSPAGEAYDLLVELGREEILVGKMAEAEYWLSKAIAMRPEMPYPYMELAQARKFTAADIPLIEKMEALSGSTVSGPKRAMEFALGKVRTDLGDYDTSFAHYRAGNDLVRQSVPYDPASEARTTDEKIAWFSAERLRSMPSGSDSALPILIVGTPRSGTTLTEQIISSHSQVAGAGELTFWHRLWGKVASAFPDRFTPTLSRQLAEGYLSYLRQFAPDAKHITDKMPGNFHHLGLIHAVLPNAKIVHCQRHPIDACLSIYFQNFPDAHRYKWDLDSLANWYEQYQRLMAHWRAVLPPGTMFELQYEELVEDTEGVSRRLMNFLGLEWEASQVDFYKQDRAVFTASKWQARQPVYKTSRERWRMYEKHLGPLLPLLKYT
jgi:Flp pilus assembly protein TadD